MNNDTLWKLPHPSHVLKCIEKWRNLDLRKKDDLEIDSELRSFVKSIERYCSFNIDNHYSSLWRIRRFDYLIKDISECWEPPIENSIMGRCNSKGTSVLYVSEDLKTPFEELFVKPQEQVYIIKYKSTQSLKLKRVVPDQFIAQNNGEPLFDDDSMLSYQILREFVRTEFLKPVGKGTEYLHRISSSMCRVWFDDMNSDGWLYPSVQSPSDFNIAVKPKSAHEKLVIEYVGIAKMVNKEDIATSERIDDSFLPSFNMSKMVIETIFKGNINQNKM